MNKLKHCGLMLALALLAQTASADSELQIRLDTINAGDTKQKVLAIIELPTNQETHQLLGMTCEQLTFKKALSQEEATITLCFDRVVATKYTARSLLGL